MKNCKKLKVCVAFVLCVLPVFSSDINNIFNAKGEPVDHRGRTVMAISVKDYEAFAEKSSQHAQAILDFYGSQYVPLSEKVWARIQELAKSEAK